MPSDWSMFGFGIVAKLLSPTGLLGFGILHRITTPTPTEPTPAPATKACCAACAPHGGKGGTCRKSG